MLCLVVQRVKEGVYQIEMVGGMNYAKRLVDDFIFVHAGDERFSKAEVIYIAVRHIEQIFRVGNSFAANNEVARLYGVLIIINFESSASVAHENKLGMSMFVRLFVQSAATNIV